jgi:hypothetical protein
MLIMDQDDPVLRKCLGLAGDKSSASIWYYGEPPRFIVYYINPVWVSAYEDRNHLNVMVTGFSKLIIGNTLVAAGF